MWGLPCMVPWHREPWERGSHCDSGPPVLCNAGNTPVVCHVEGLASRHHSNGVIMVGRWRLLKQRKACDCRVMLRGPVHGCTMALLLHGQLEARRRSALQLAK